MRVLCAPDKFKFACAAREAAGAIARGVKLALPDAECIELPLADGGEGTLDALSVVFPRLETIEAQDALGRPAMAALRHDGAGAWLIESAQACGLARLDESDRNPLETTTYGVGLLVRHALDQGARRVLVGLGGSATNDAGAGMARALGLRFYGERGEIEKLTGRTIADVRHIDRAGLDRRLEGIEFTALCDVDAPLLGPGGASRRYALQKGGTTRTIGVLEKNLATFAAVAAPLGSRLPVQPGAGAAGGLGFGMKAMLGAKLANGGERVLDLLGSDTRLAGADLVLTGEGALDDQTADGKLVSVLARRCKSLGVPCVVLTGRLRTESEIAGVTAAFEITPYGMRKQDALARTADNLARVARDVVRVFSSRRA